MRHANPKQIPLGVGQCMLPPYAGRNDFMVDCKGPYIFHGEWDLFLHRGFIFIISWLQILLFGSG